MPHWRRLIFLLLLITTSAATVLHRAWLPPVWDPVEPLDLQAPPNVLRPLKLRLLSSSPALCKAALRTAPLHIHAYSAAGSVLCPIPDVMTVSGGPAPGMPEPFLASCRLAVRWSLFETEIAPIVRDAFGTELRRIRQAGSFACRDIRDHPGVRSSHASADAIDVSGFLLADGREISVSSWNSHDQRGVFLHTVRDHACRLFGIVLSPDYNSLHATHLHLQATGFGLCR